MAGLKPPSSHPILNLFLRPPPSSLFLIKPLTAIALHHAPTHRSTFSSTRGTLLVPLSSLFLSTHKPPLRSAPCSLSTSQPTLDPELSDADSEFEIVNENFESEEEEDDDEGEEEEAIGADRELNTSPSTQGKDWPPAKLPSLTVKEKKELVSYAHSLGKKLKSQQVGKSGVTDSVATALVETLESNELLKLKIHNSCPGELDDVVTQLERATGSVVVGQIGRTVILYRPSLTKLRAEEKREQARKVFRRKPLTFKRPYEAKRQLPRLNGRGRRGSSRFLTPS